MARSSSVSRALLETFHVNGLRGVLPGSLNWLNLKVYYAAVAMVGLGKPPGKALSSASLGSSSCASSPSNNKSLSYRPRELGGVTLSSNIGYSWLITALKR